jgi:predicted NBD/HSP70 family sugar kinase
MSTPTFSFIRNQTASNRTPRKINRNLIFNLIRKRHPISRADLARLTGLQRSTISLIVEELIVEGWLVQDSVGKVRRGRNPTFLGLNRRQAIIALDIHQSHTIVALTDIEGKTIFQQVLFAPPDISRIFSLIVSTIIEIRADHKHLSFCGIGICLPRRTDLYLRKLIVAQNFKWPGLSLKSKMEHAIGLVVTMDNVANVCALSEVWFGSSDGLNDLVVINICEGIGVGIFANGRLVRGERGMAGEFGHIQIKPDGPLCGCGNRGCWETLASNQAAISFYMELASPTMTPSFEMLVKYSQSGDRAAVQALTKMAQYLGHGIQMISVALAPKEIVVVGEVTSAWHILGSTIREQLKRNTSTEVPVIRPVYDGNAARLKGVVALVLGEDSVDAEP